GDDGDDTTDDTDDGDNGSDETYDGTDGKDVWNDQSGEQTYNGGEGYDQVDYDGALSDYSMEQKDDGSVEITNEDGETDTLKGIDGLWFNGEGEWYSIDYALELAGADNTGDTDGDDSDDTTDDTDDGDNGGDETYEGTDGSDDKDVWNDQSGDQTYNGGEGYDQVNYKGSLSDYSLNKEDDGSVTVTHESGEVDTLIDIEGFWFDGEGEWYSIEYALEEADFA
ncbi:MAG: hypothetical protein ABJH63_01710, partial [Rhizobiaceae bacterium]